MRKLANAGSGAQETMAPRGMLIGGPDPAEYIREQQDRQRDSLAERLLELLAKNATWVNSEELIAEVGGDMVAMANAALAAAEVIYPEIPSGVPDHPGVSMSIPNMPLPAAAREGAESVMDQAVDAYLNDPRRTLREGCWEMTPEEYQRRLAAGEVGDRKVVIDHSQGSVGRFPEEPAPPTQAQIDLMAALKASLARGGSPMADALPGGKVVTSTESVLDAAGDVYPDELPIRGEG